MDQMGFTFKHHARFGIIKKWDYQEVSLLNLIPSVQVLARLAI